MKEKDRKLEEMKEKGRKLEGRDGNGRTSKGKGKNDMENRKQEKKMVKIRRNGKTRGEKGRIGEKKPKRREGFVKKRIESRKTGLCQSLFVSHLFQRFKKCLLIKIFLIVPNR